MRRLGALLGLLLGAPLVLGPLGIPLFALDLEVDCAKALDEIRPLHGGNCGPVQYGDTLDLSERFREIGFPLIRLHDCHWPSGDVVDFHAVFPHPDADPELADSYDFRRTDAYIQSIVDLGSGIVYRLGESIEHSRRKYHVVPPDDPERWAQIAVGIVRHYNEGWASGFHHGIRYWEIWNEPENRPQMWTGTDEEYFRLYEVASMKIKERFPDLKVGGPSLGHTGRIERDRFEPGEFLLRFLERCRDRRLPLDFFSWHLYTDDPAECVVRAKGIREALDRFGFEQAESHLNEWNYLPGGDWSPLGVAGQGLPRERFYERIDGPPGAAFVACVLSNLQGAPVDAANHYMSENHAFGLFTPHGVPTKAFYALKAFRRLRETPVRLATSGGQADRLTIAAGIDRERSRVGVLVSSLPASDPAPEGAPVRLFLRGLPWERGSQFELSLVDATRNLEAVRSGEWPEEGLDLTTLLRAPRVAFVTVSRGAPVLRHSEVVFMYASTPEAYDAYGATFVAWGGAETPEKVQMHRDRGIRSTGSVWCLTAGAKALHEDAKLREAVAVDIEGKPIAVPWLFDHVHEGQKTLFGNTNHPAFREHVRANVRRVMAAGADGLHVDDHLGVASPALWYGGAFDDFSVAGFRSYLAKRATPETLAAAGVKDLASFDYRTLVREHATTAEEVKRKQGQIPLFDVWREYHLEAAADFVEELRDVAAEAAGHPVLLSANACLAEPAHHQVVPRLTHVVCEVWFDAHRGTASLDGALRAYAAAERLGRPLACTASGHDWAHVKASGAKEIAKFWIALTYAHGQRFMVPHPSRQWCFSESLGTHWYAAPVAEFAPLYRFVRANASLFDGFEAASDIRATAPPGLLAKARRKGASVSIHLVSTDYDAERARFRPASNVRLEIRGLPPPARDRARLLRYDGEPLDLELSVEGEAAVVTLPDARLWSLVAVE